MTWILTQSIFWDYTSTSLFILYMCVPFCYPLFPLIVFTLFASSGSSVFSSSTGGRNNLITLSLPPPASYFCRSQITEEKKNPCFWDTNYRFCSSFALRCWNPLSNPIKGRRENKVKVLMIIKKGLNWAYVIFRVSPGWGQEEKKKLWLQGEQRSTLCTTIFLILLN